MAVHGERVSWQLKRWAWNQTRHPHGGQVLAGEREEPEAGEQPCLARSRIGRARDLGCLRAAGIQERLWKESQNQLETHSSPPFHLPVETSLTRFRSLWPPWSFTARFTLSLPTVCVNFSSFLTCHSFITTLHRCSMTVALFLFSQ